MLKKIVWEKNAIFSLKLRDDLFTLVQMREGSILQFFDIRATKNEWADIDLNTKSTLFFNIAAEKPLKTLFIEKIDPLRVKPSTKPIEKMMLSSTTEWVPEKQITLFGADLIELSADYSSYGGRIVKKGLTVKDDLETIYKYEWNGMIGDPEKLRKRLIRYFDTGVNFDDSTSFTFKDIPLPPAKKA
jgi:hypothetical protein